MIENFLNDLLANLGAKNKETVFVSVTPGIGLEMIQIDPAIKAVQLYAYKPLKYNDTMRDIADFDEFKTALEALFAELKISPKCNVILNLPMVHFGKISLPLILNDESIENAIISEVEQAYIFKRCEPVVSWFEAIGNSADKDNRTFFYSAIQKETVDKIKTILSDMGATLSRLEISLTSTLRALSYADTADKAQMLDGISWNLMIVNSNGLSIASMNGKNIVDYYEEPLALKTYEPDEIYDAISGSASVALMSFPANFLYIVSETDLVSAELLSSKITYDGRIEFIENNNFRKREFLPVSLNILPDQVTKISLNAIGIATTKFEAFPIRLDFSGNEFDPFDDGTDTLTIDFNGRQVVLTGSVLKKITIIAAIVIIIPLIVLLFTIPKITETEKTQLDSVNSEIQKYDSEINKLRSQTSTKGAFVVSTEVENVLKSNRAKLMAYTALGESVPQDLWITYFSVNNSGQLDIKGISEDVENVYVFFRNLKASLVNENVRLEKLEMLSNSIDDAIITLGPTLYEFQIVNGKAGSSNNVSSTPTPTPTPNKNKNKGALQNLSPSKGSLQNLKPIKQIETPQ